MLIICTTVASEISEAVVRRCSVKNVVLKILQNSQENTCARVFFNKVAGLRPQPCNFIKNETQLSSCEFCEIFKYSFFTEHFRMTSSEIYINPCSLYSYEPGIFKNFCRTFKPVFDLADISRISIDMYYIRIRNLSFSRPKRVT